jgi:hypothetical protein
MSNKGLFKVRTLLGLAAVIALALGAILATSPALSQSLRVLSTKSRSLEERDERAQPAILDREFPGKQKDDLVVPSLDRQFPGKEKDDLVVRSLDRHFPGKEKDDLVVPSLDRHFPGKEKDDLVAP